VGLLDTRRHLVDVRLCDARNSIAHGEHAIPTPDSVLELHREVLKMMDEVRGEILDAVWGSKYKR
jgi:hypothetical protein